MSVKLKTVLVVDDNEALAQVVALTLRAAGFEVCTACDGIDGYMSYLRSPADWVLTDIQMPKLDGVGMMRLIRVLNPRVKMLYMSGAVDQFNAVLQREIAEFGARVLRKPFARNQLITLLIESGDGLATML